MQIYLHEISLERASSKVAALPLDDEEYDMVQVRLHISYRTVQSTISLIFGSLAYFADLFQEPLGE